MISAKPEKEEEVRGKKHKTFVEKFEKYIRHFLLLNYRNDSQRYLLNSVR